MWRKVCVAVCGLLLVGLAGAARATEVFVQVLDAEAGFGQYLWYDEDFGWTHLVPRDVSESHLIDATLTIEAEDIDAGEVDLIYADALLLGALQGANGIWSLTSFSLIDDLDLLIDGQLDVFVDIDSEHNERWWAATIGQSILEIIYRPESPKLRIRSLSLPAGGGGAEGQPGGMVEVVLANLGAKRYVGPCTIDAGLAYSRQWIPEWCTVFDTHDAGIIDLMPGEAVALTFPLDEVPADLYDLFRSRLETMWTGYEDTDPDYDYVGFVVQFNGLPPQVDYGPLD